MAIRTLPPTNGRPTFAITSSKPLASCKGVTAPAVAKGLLEVIANVGRPFVGGNVRIAIVQHAQRARQFALLMTVELFEERNQSERIFDGDVRASGDFLFDALVGFGARTGAHGRGS